MGSDNLNDSTNVFYVDVNGKKVVAEILVTFYFYDNLYCAYSIKNDETDLNDVYSAKIVDHSLVDITNEKEKQMIDQYIFNLLKTVKEV